MTSTIVDPSLYGSPITSASSGFQSNTSEKSRLSHNGDDPGGGMTQDGNDANANSMPSKDAMRQSLKDVIRYRNFFDVEIFGVNIFELYIKFEIKDYNSSLILVVSLLLRFKK